MWCSDLKCLVKMTGFLYVLAVCVVVARAEVLDLSCSDNVTCIENLAREFVRGVRQQKTVRLFDTVTIEPFGNHRQARSNQGALAKFLSTHAVSFDWDDYSFRFTKPASRSGVMEMDVFRGRAVEEEPTESSTKVSKKGSAIEDKEEPKPKRRIIRRRHSKLIMQAILPIMMGMKSASTVILAIAAVAALTMKAFIASKLALLVTVSMAAKKLYESFGQGVGLQNHPYLYSQYPIDFPSATSNAYSVSGLTNSQFPNPELYSPTALASHTHQDMLQSNDISASQSQPAATLQLANSTRATERWDGKSKLLNLVKPIVDTVKSVVQPLAGKIVDVMPKRFRAMTSKAFGLEEKEEELEDFMESRVPKGVDLEAAYKPKQILVPKPRLIQKDMIARTEHAKVGPKKVKNKFVDINKLKVNKDLNDYAKTKKYIYNYENTHFHPRMKYFSEPSANYQNIYKISETSKQKVETEVDDFKDTDWQPFAPSYDTLENYRNIYYKELEEVPIVHKILRRQKRDTNYEIKDIEKEEISNNAFVLRNPHNEVRASAGDSYDVSDLFLNTNPVNDIMKQVDKYVKSQIKHQYQHNPVGTTSQKMYYVGIEMVKFGLQMFDVYMDMADSIYVHLTNDKLHKKKGGHGHKPHHHGHKPHHHGHKPHHDEHKPHHHHYHHNKPSHGHDEDNSKFKSSKKSSNKAAIKKTLVYKKINRRG